MRLGRAGAIAAGRARGRAINKEQEMAVRAGQDKAIKRASDASRENERHSDLEFGNSRSHDRDSS